MLDVKDCRAAERLEMSGTEDISFPQREWYEHHLETCAACQERLDHVEGEDTLRQLATQVGDPTARPPDPTLEEFLQRIRQQEYPGCAEPGPVELYFLKPTDQPNLLGTLGPYEIQEVIGQGGMGLVLKAFEPALQRLVAIKVLAPALAGSATARRRFTREARASAAVRHENIVTVHAVDEIQSLPYLVMEYVAGESLQDRLDANGSLELREIVQIGWQTAAGLAAAHAQGLIHRDIKPANILLEHGQCRVKITDFGLARMVDDVQLTQNGVIVGTPEYMAPEQARGEQVDHRADLFSLGSVLYAMCTGGAPFRGATTLGVMRSISESSPPPVRAVNSEIPAWLERLITLLLARERNDRLPSAAVVADLLAGYLAHLNQPSAIAVPELPPLSTNESPSQPKQPTPKGISKLRWPILAALFLLFLGSGYWMFTGLFAQTEAPSQAASPVDFYHDFRNGRPLPPELEFYGAAGGKYFQEEPEGFRITLPKGFLHPWGGTGLATTFGIEGDFEITTTVEILSAETPKAGFGSGVRLYINKPDSREGTTLCRLVRPGGHELLLWDRTIEEDKEKDKVRITEGMVPCTDTKVALRLKRQGKTLHYLWAPAGSQNFIEFHRAEFGDFPIKRVTLTAINGRQATNLDVRFIDLRIRGGQTGETVSTPAAGSLEGSSGSGGGWLWLAVLGGAVPLLGLGLWLYWRKNGSAANSDDEDEEGDDDEDDDDEEPRPRKKTRGSQQGRQLGLLSLLLPLIPFMLAALLLGLRLPVWLAEASAAEEARPVHSETDQRNDFFLSFTDNPENLKQLKLLPPDRDGFVKAEAEGIRITLPKGIEGVREGVHLSADAPVKGDFEITLGFEILDEPPPPLDYSGGLELVVELDTPTKTQAAVSRTVRGGIGSAFSTWLSVEEKEGEKPVRNMTFAPTKAKKGKLRLIRTGSTLLCYAAGEDGLLTLLMRHPLGPEDLKSVAINASTGGPKTFLDARVTDLRIQTDAPPADAAPALTSQSSAGMPFDIVAVVLAAALAALGVWLGVRQGWKARQPDPVALMVGVTACLLVFLVGVSSAGLFAAPPAQQTAPKTFQELALSLRGPENAPGFDFVGPGADKCVQFEPEGLRIQLPPGWGGERPATGAMSSMVLKGDFEITLRFDILKEPDEVQAKTGTRLSLGVFLNTPKPTVATINRSVGEKNRKVFVAWMSRWNEETQKAQSKSRNIGTDAMSGELRLVRKGAVLSYYVAEKPGADFVLVRQYHFGEEDVREIRIAGSTGDKQAMLDALVTDLRIRAEGLPGMPTLEQPTATRSGSLLVSSIIVLALALAGFGAWWTVRHRSRTETAAPPSEEVEASTEPTPATVSFACTGCQKRLKVNAALAGKRIKCPQCGTVRLIETAAR